MLNVISLQHEIIISEPYGLLDDDELIDLLIALDKPGQEVFYAAYYGRVHAIALKISLNDDDADDITIIALNKAMKEIATFKKGSTLMTWLYRITTNEALDYVRKRDCDKNTTDQFKYDEKDKMINEPSHNNNPESDMKNAQLGDKIAHARTLLKPNQKLCYGLLQDEDKTYEEIADITGLTPATVKQSIYLAKQFLQKCLQDEWDTLNE